MQRLDHGLFRVGVRRIQASQPEGGEEASCAFRVADLTIVLFEGVDLFPFVLGLHRPSKSEPEH